MKNIEPKQIIKALENHKYSIFRNDTKAFNLNIVGVRAIVPKVEEFNCKMTALWWYKGSLNFYQMAMTSVAGMKYLTSPMNPKGCAILKEGQYKGVYKLDLHNNSYRAYCQRLGNVTVYRDNDKDRELDFIEGSEETGMFGINLHRASAKGEVADPNAYSAGCNVVCNPSEFDIFRSLGDEALDSGWGNAFTYTLINEADLSG